MKKIKVRTFSSYGLIDRADYYKQIYKYLVKTKQSYCFTVECGFISRDDCLRFQTKEQVRAK